MAMMMTAREVINKESVTILLIRFCSDIEIIKTTTDLSRINTGKTNPFIILLFLCVYLCPSVVLLRFCFFILSCRQSLSFLYMSLYHYIWRVLSGLCIRNL